MGRGTCPPSQYLGSAPDGEPSTAPQAGRWYDLSLGSSFKDDPSTKFCTLRYEFKPASIDKSQPASLHKNKDNRVTVEFFNNHPGKPKVTFEGCIEEYKKIDGVLFFDGETFRLERLHRAVKRLRHVRMPGESAAIAAAVASASASGSIPAAVGSGVETRSPSFVRMGKSQHLPKSVVHSVPVEVEKIDIGEPEMSAFVKPVTRPNEHPLAQQSRSLPSCERKTRDFDENYHHSLFQEDDELNELVNQNDSDDEIADVDVSDTEGDKGLNAAEVLRAEVNAEQAYQQQTSSSSGSSRSKSSSSSDSETNDGDTAMSPDIDI